MTTWSLGTPHYVTDTDELVQHHHTIKPRSHLGCFRLPVEDKNTAEHKAEPATEPGKQTGSGRFFPGDGAQGRYIRG